MLTGVLSAEDDSEVARGRSDVVRHPEQRHRHLLQHRPRAQQHQGAQTLETLSGLRLLSVGLG